MDFTYRPLDAWPGEETPHHQRKRSQFSSGWGTTLRQLTSELEKLRARQVVMLVAVAPEDFRIRDGHPKANARWFHPGVVIAFESIHGPLKYACDTFDQFPDNVRAIALGLEALRKVERYGITKRGEQYRGWSALPPARTTGETMSKPEAARVLADLAWEDQANDVLLLDAPDVPIPGQVEVAYRLAVKRHHPDQGGNADLFRRATEARNVLIGAT